MKNGGTLCWSMFPFILAPLSPIYEPEVRKKYRLTGYLNQWQHATMNSNQALAQILRTFLEIKNSGPIYRGDNQEILGRLGPSIRRKFEATRHMLSQKALNGTLEQETLFKSFKQILPW